MPLDVGNALLDANAYNYATLAYVGHGDLNIDRAVPTGFQCGSIFILCSPFMEGIVQFVQNRSGAAFAQGALVSGVGDTNGVTAITTSGVAAVNTTTQLTTTGLTANRHVGGLAHVVNSLAGAGVAPEGETGIVVANTTTTVNLDPNLPFSATASSGDTVNLVGTGNVELSAIGDMGFAVRGVVIGKNGISDGNFGWVKKQGMCPNTLVKAATALTQNDALVADVGRVGPALGGAATAAQQVGTALHVMNSDSVSDKTCVLLTLGFGYNPGTLDASA